jgi:hypothetical protein
VGIGAYAVALQLCLARGYRHIRTELWLVGLAMVVVVVVDA